MQRIVWTLPVVAGQEAALTDKINLIKGDQRADWTASRKAVGLACERVFLQKTPSGSQIVLSWDLTTSFEQVLSSFQTSSMPFDMEFRSFIKQVHGIDVNDTSAPMPEPPMCIVDWCDASWTWGSGECWGTAIPLKPGSTDTFRSAIAGAYAKTDSWNEWRRQSGFGVTTICIQSTPMGDFAVLYLEANDIAAAMADVRESDHEFSVLWREIAPKCYAIDVTNPANVPDVTHLATIEAFQPALAS